MASMYCRYKRGDVWFLRLPTEDGDGLRGSSVIKKSRPFLIVSCDRNNQESTVFSVAPITTKEPDDRPMHVFFVYQDKRYGSRNQVIECEQITTVSVQVFEDSRSFYLYSLMPDLMDKVDSALAYQFGLSLVPAVDSEQRIRDIIREELAKSASENVEQQPEELASPISQDKSSSPKAPHRHGARWTDDERLQYLIDYESMGRVAVADHYRISPRSAAQFAYEFRKRLGVDAS